MRSTLAAALACMLISGAAHADDSVTVWLKDGSMVRGELVERVPNDHVTLKLATGEVRRIEWKDLDHDSLATKTEPKPAEPDEIDDDSAHKPNPKAKAAADYVPPDVGSSSGGEGGARITGGDGYLLQRLEGTFSGSGYGYGPRPTRVSVSGEIWKTVCVTPCNESVAPGTYRIDGPGIPTSSKFELRGNERVEISPGNSVGHYGGQMLFIAGAGAAILGGIFYAGDSGNGGAEVSTGTKTLFFGGLAAAAIGLPLWLLSRTTIDVKGNGSLSLRPTGIAFF